jgi:hypothetical protein
MEQSMTTESENRILIGAVRIAAEQIENLKSGPGGIMEMKQTIADKETEIARLQQYESTVANKDKIIDDLKATMRGAMFQINCEDPWQAYEILEEAVQKTTGPE